MNIVTQRKGKFEMAKIIVEMDEKFEWYELWDQIFEGKWSIKD